MRSPFAHEEELAKALTQLAVLAGFILVVLITTQVIISR